MVSLIATQSYAYDKRSLSPGDAFDASEKDAALLKLIGRAKDAPSPRSRLFQTRDLAPESTVDAENDVPRQRLQYRRRDLTPEA